MLRFFGREKDYYQTLFFPPFFFFHFFGGTPRLMGPIGKNLLFCPTNPIMAEKVYTKFNLSSILQQLDKDDEVIICDDGSSDGTLDIINLLEDPRIKLFQNSFQNVILNFESAIEKAKGDYIFLSDQDDIWYENKVEEIMCHLQSNMMVFSNLSLFKGAEFKNLELLYDRDKNRTGFIKNLISNNYVGATMAFNKNLVKHILPFPKNLNMHDSWIGLIAEIYGNTKYIGEPLIYYRRHQNNLSTTGGSSINGLAKKAGIRINLITKIIRRVVRDI